MREVVSLGRGDMNMMHANVKVSLDVCCRQAEWWCCSTLGVKFVLWPIVTGLVPMLYGVSFLEKIVNDQTKRT